MKYRFINIFNLFVIAPLFILVGLDKFPNEHKKWLILLGIFLVVVNACKLFASVRKHRLEGMEGNFEVDEINGVKVHNIRIFDSSPGYEFPVYSIGLGDVVVWTNVGEVQHSVTEENEVFNSGYLQPGDQFSVKFTEKGIYNYYCIPHKGWMLGKIIVE